MSRMVSFFVLIAIIVVIGFLFFRVMAPFLLPLFLAAMLVVIVHPVHVRILERCKGRQRLASALTTALVLLIVLLPLLGITFMAFAEGSAMVARQDPGELRDKIGKARDQFELLRMPHAPELRTTERSFDQLLAKVDQYPLEESRSLIESVSANLSELRLISSPPPNGQLPSSIPSKTSCSKRNRPAKKNSRQPSTDSTSARQPASSMT